MTEVASEYEEAQRASMADLRTELTEDSSREESKYKEYVAIKWRRVLVDVREGVSRREVLEIEQQNSTGLRPSVTGGPGLADPADIARQMHSFESLGNSPMYVITLKRTYKSINPSCSYHAKPTALGPELDQP